MSAESDLRADEFLAVASQFRLGALTTEGVHPATADLSATAERSVAAGLAMLFQADRDVLKRFEGWIASGALERIGDSLGERLAGGGRVIFTGCGSTGRLSILLDSIWREWWQSRDPGNPMGDRSRSAMAGGDFALIKSVEGFEDFTQFGRRQAADLRIGGADTVFAITEGGETSWVIGTAWEAVDRGASVYFVYNNPDDELRATVDRSREVIDDPRIEKVSLTTGPMAISGSTRMQATTIQLLVLTSILERALARLLGESPSAVTALRAGAIAAFDGVCSTRVQADLARLVEMEEAVCRGGGRTNYFADSLAIDMLTDTTERSPTFCTPPFRRFDDSSASESWAFLYTPVQDTRAAWRRLLRRAPETIRWGAGEVRDLVGPDLAERMTATVARIGEADLLRFRIGRDGERDRPPRSGDGAIVLATEGDEGHLGPDGILEASLARASAAGAHCGVILAGRSGWVAEMGSAIAERLPAVVAVGLAIEAGPGRLNGLLRASVKMLLNAHSTCVMVRLGRVMGNTMVRVVPSNLKLIDRATRYIARLGGVDYERACRMLFEVLEYVEPRMKADREYPPVVGMAVTRLATGVDCEAAEAAIGRQELASR